METPFAPGSVAHPFPWLFPQLAKTSGWAQHVPEVPTPAPGAEPYCLASCLLRAGKETRERGERLSALWGHCLEHVRQPARQELQWVAHKLGFPAGFNHEKHAGKKYFLRQHGGLCSTLQR